MGGRFVLVLLAVGLAAPACTDPYPTDPMPFTIQDGYFAVRDGANYRQVFVKGVNLGTGVPGTQAGALAITYEQYLRWFERMSEIGVNVFRIYTLHHPRFYEALFEHNNYRPENPLYFIQGVWLDEEHPEHSVNLPDFSWQFDKGAVENVRAVHGDITIPTRQGRAYGEFNVDVSDWCMGWLVGREVFPVEVNQTNLENPDMTSYAGDALSLPSGTATEVWLTERADLLLVYERDRYGATRPISISSWPTLDPLFHPLEPHFGANAGEDSQQIDLANIDISNAPGGFFANFHAYPYYPNFVSEDPDYLLFEDEIGVNSYLGYISDLIDHYAPIPVLIGEFGVPTSWGNAHYGHSGMNHGGHNSIEQGQNARRMLHNMLDAGGPGGLLFSWQDEWWKRTWIVDELEQPRDRFRFWHNVTSPEENFGLLRFKLPDPTFQLFAPVTSAGAVREVRTDYNAAYFFVRLELAQPLAAGETLTVALDTYGDALGDSILPNGVATQNRNEFAVEISGAGTAQLYVMSTYDTEGIFHETSAEFQLYRSILSDAGLWSPVIWKNDGEHFSDDGSYYFPPTFDPIGELVVRQAEETPTLLDSVVFDGNVVTIALPWTLLHFTDPSQLEVLHDDKATPGREIATSAGIAVGVSFKGELLESGRFRWPAWEGAPETEEVEKPSMQIFSDALAGLPNFLD